MHASAACVYPCEDVTIYVSRLSFYCWKNLHSTLQSVRSTVNSAARVHCRDGYPSLGLFENLKEALLKRSSAEEEQRTLTPSKHMYSRTVQFPHSLRTPYPLQSLNTHRVSKAQHTKRDNIFLVVIVSVKRKIKTEELQTSSSLRSIRFLTCGCMLKRSKGARSVRILGLFMLPSSSRRCSPCSDASTAKSGAACGAARKSCSASFHRPGYRSPGGLGRIRRCVSRDP